MISDNIRDDTGGDDIPTPDVEKDEVDAAKHCTHVLTGKISTIEQLIAITQMLID